MPETKPLEPEFSFKSYFVPFTTTKAIHFIVIVGLVVYFNSLFNGFIGDDYGQLVNNSSVHSLSNIVQFFSNSTFNNSTVSNISSNGNNSLAGIYYKPLLSSVYSIIYTFFGSWAPAYHFFQLALHISNSILIFIMFKKLLKKEIAFAAALLFLVHPINNESVVFISDMQETLFLFFGLLAFWFTLQKKYNLYTNIIITILLLCSLLSKETGFLFILIIPLFQILFQGKWKIGLLQSSIAVCTYLILRFGVAHVYLNNTDLVTIPFSHIPLLQKIENIPAIILYYLTIFFFPKDLTMGQRWIISQINSNTFYIPLAIDLLFFLIITLLGLIIYKRNRSIFKLFIFFTIWFLIGLCLHLQLLPLDATVATRWFYFPIIGLLGIVGTTLNIVNFNKRRILIVYCIILAIITSIFGVRDFIRSTNWNNELTLYHYEIQYAPNDYILQLNYASALANAGNQKEAIEHIKDSIRLHPTVENWDLLAFTYAKSHKIKEAKEALAKALTYDNKSYSSYMLLTEIMLAYDPPKPTTIILKKFLTKYPKDPAVWLYLAVEEYKLGDKSGALFAAQKSLSIYPSQQGANLYSDMMSNKSVNIHFSF